MKKFEMKRGFAVLLTVLMLLSLVGCGGRTKPHDHGPDAKDEIYVAVNKDGHKTVVDKNGNPIALFQLDKDGNIADKDGEIVIPADKVQELPKTPAKPSKKPVYVKKDKNGKEQVVDQSGKPVEGYTVDEDGNISDEDGNTVVESSEVTTPPAKPDKNNSHEGDAHKEDSSSGTSSGSSGSSGSSSSSSSHSEKPAPAKPSKPAPAKPSKPAPAKPSKPDPKPEKPAKPVHKHSWKPVYRTETVEVEKHVYARYCDDCGQIFYWKDPYTGEYHDVMTDDEMNDHLIAHVVNGESGRDKTNSSQTMIFTEERQVIDHYECSCGATK